MENQKLANEIEALKETIETLNNTIKYLIDGLEKTNKTNEKLKEEISDLKYQIMTKI